LLGFWPANYQESSACSQEGMDQGLRQQTTCSATAVCHREGGLQRPDNSMQAGSLQDHRQSPLQHAGGGQREHACIHEVAKKLPACGCLKAFQTLLLCHSVQCATGGHTPCHTLSQCTIQLIRDEAIQHRRRLLSAALGPKSPRRKSNHKPYSSSLEQQCPGGSVLEEFVD